MKLRKNDRKLKLFRGSTHANMRLGIEGRVIEFLFCSPHERGYSGRAAEKKTTEQDINK